MVRLRIIICFLLVFAFISAAYGQFSEGPASQHTPGPQVEPDGQSPQPKPILSPELPKACPQTRYVNCMPIVPEEKRFLCSPEYLEWIKANCPGVEVVH